MDYYDFMCTKNNLKRQYKNNNILYDLMLLNDIKGLLCIIIINLNRFHESLFGDHNKYYTY